MTRLNIATTITPDPLFPSHSWSVLVEVVECDGCQQRIPMEFADTWASLWWSNMQEPTAQNRVHQGDFCSRECAAAYLAREVA